MWHLVATLGHLKPTKSRTTPKMALSRTLRITKTTIFAISTDKEQR